MLESVTRAFSHDVAEALVNFQASAAAKTRVDALAAKANEGTLTSTERSEYESYVHRLDLISLLQLKARLWLARERRS
jgi:hypothetical protein